MPALPYSELFFELLAQPTAPFRETHVAAAVTRAMDAAGIPYFADPVGNLVLGVPDRKAYAALLSAPDAEPVRLFVAHMDHPGFHGVRWDGERLLVRWHGGSPARRLAGAPVWLADASGWRGAGSLTQVRLRPNGRAIETAAVRVPAAELAPLRAGPPGSLYGGFRFRAPVWRAGRRVYTKAADDLVGVFSVCATALNLFRRRRPSPPPFIGLLTRAEEVGFVGAIGHFELGWVQAARRPVVCVSLEASRTLPGAAVGKGPVVRLGDWRTVFSPDGIQVLAGVAQRVLPGRHQRRIMDGGACEATAATAYGVPAIGISVPLGNYHNEGYEGGPDCRGPRGPAPEFVHLDDVRGQVLLCQGLMAAGLGWGDPWRASRGELRKRWRDARPLLKG